MGNVTLNGATSGSITIAPPAVAGTNTLSLPAATDTIVTLAASQTLTNKSIDAGQLTGSIAKARLPTGSILQVVSTTKTDTFSSATTAGTYVDITGLSVSITPSSATSKIFVVFAIGATGTNTSQDIMFRLVRNSTNIAIADSGPTYTTTVAVRSLNAELTSTPTMFYLDSPATTSATTYKITGSTSGGGTLVVNKRQSDTSFGAVSTITVMEVAA